MKNLLSLLSAPINNYLNQPGDLVAPAAAHSLIFTNLKPPVLLVTTSTRAAQELANEIIAFEGFDSVVNFPAWETLPHERLSPKSDTVTMRFKALNKIKNQECKFIICSIRALLQPIIDNDLAKSQIKVFKGATMAMADLITKLSELGFTRSDLVERRGDFAVRGGILDLFPADQEHPIRIDFFGAWNHLLLG